jgi:hypothetical protein
MEFSNQTVLFQPDQMPPQPDQMPPQHMGTNTIYSQSVDTSPGRYIYSIFHSIMSLVAFYLSFRCNKGFHFGSFLMACCCPYIYIIYVLATKGTCGVLDK